MTWDELSEIARNAITSELGATMPKTLAERVARRIVEDVKIGMAGSFEFPELCDGIQLIQEPDSVWED